jgi:hypothetical protein
MNFQKEIAKLKSSSEACNAEFLRANAEIVKQISEVRKNVKSLTWWVFFCQCANALAWILFLLLLVGVGVE